MDMPQHFFVAPSHERRSSPDLRIARPATPLARRHASSAGTFKSFWMGGFEGADRISYCDVPRAICDVTQHAANAAADYERLADFDIRSVRESAAWRLIDCRGHYDFSSLQCRAHAARVLDIQIVWTLFQFGWPADIDVFSTAFVDRFARYARATASFLGEFSAAAPVYAPINEISFLAWVAGASGRIPGYHAAIAGRSGEFKRQLVRAAIAACDAILEVDPRARFMHTDPLMHVAAPAGRADLALEARRRREHHFEMWDMLSGRACPELGGAPRYLDIVGANYYADNQWDLLSGRPLVWNLDDPRRVPLATLLEFVGRRYRRPVVIAETSHAGVRSANWIREVAAEVGTARARDVTVEGICLHPILDRPDSRNHSHWHDCGLWNLEPTIHGILRRRLNEQYAAGLRNARTAIQSQAQERPLTLVAAGQPPVAWSERIRARM